MKKLILAIALLLISNPFFSQTFNVSGGYFPYWRSTAGIDLSTFNYLYYAFVVPSNSGGVLLENNSTAAFNSFKNATANLSSKRLISVGSTNCPTMAADATARKNFADGLRIFCRTHNFDGIDIDWEAINNSTDQANFTALMHDIRNEIDSTDLEFVITVGYGNYNLQWYSNEALHLADFIQIMVYDQTGTWSSSPYGNHASMNHYLDAETYWVSRGFTRDKMVMGLPYYGYRFNSTSGGLADAITYADILAHFPNATAADNLLSDNTGYYWFNGVDLIKQKTKYAKDNGFKGVFVWEIAQDNPNHSLSLNKAMKQEIAMEISEINNVAKTSFFPNPVNNILFIESEKNLGKISVYNSIGQAVYENTSNEKHIEIPASTFSPGIYFIQSNSVNIGKIVIE
ncbi:MAG: glycosyl hydrolase family 18 protein [Bacteroidetes bacterium]|nr:glycosyl hydrolase family 18 protein [Bacteroidota bacterium]